MQKPRMTNDFARTHEESIALSIIPALELLSRFGTGSTYQPTSRVIYIVILQKLKISQSETCHYN